MTADVELLPCPWCGEKLASVSVSEGSTFHWRKVDGCCTDGPEVRHNTMADDQEAAEVESRTAAIAAWNTRANVAHATAARDAEIEALRAKVEFLRRGIVPRDDDMIVPVKLLDEINASGAEWKDRAERLAEALRNSSDALERLAFAIRAPNAHTPQLVELAIAMRAAALHPAAAQEGKESFWPKLPGSGGPDWTGHD